MHHSKFFVIIYTFYSSKIIISSSRQHHRQTQHRHTLGELATQTEIQNAASMVEFFFKSQIQDSSHNYNVTKILQHGCFCKQLKHNRMNEKDNKAGTKSAHDDICEYNKLCTECSKHEAFAMYAEVDDFSDASCRQPYPYMISLDDCGNIV